MAYFPSNADARRVFSVRLSKIATRGVSRTFVFGGLYLQTFVETGTETMMMIATHQLNAVRLNMPWLRLLM